MSDGHLKRPLLHKITMLKNMSERRIFQQFARKYELVYFGHVDQHTDDHQLVRGMTLSLTHHDQHYCVGSVQGRDVTVLARSDTVKFPGKPTHHYNWIVLQVDLSPPHPLPRVIMITARYSQAFFANLFLTADRLRDCSAGLAPPAYDGAFANFYKVFADPADHPLQVVTPQIAQTVTAHWRHFDYEIEGDKLIIYAMTPLATPQTLETMLRAGLWLADQLDS